MPAEDMSRRPQGLLRWPTYAVSQLHRVSRARLDSALGEEGLSLRSHGVLVCLDEYGELSQQQVADRIATDRSDLVKLIDQLEALGQVLRRPDPVDRRRHVLSLTAQGKQAISQAEQIVGRVTGEIFASLSAEERQTLHRLALKALGASDQGASTEEGHTTATRGDR